MLEILVNRHKKKIHKLLNAMWKGVVFIQKELLNRGYTVGPLTFGMENYISIDGRLRPAHYYTPEFGFSYGVVGCTLDGLNYIASTKSKTFSETFLKEIIEDFPSMKMYGGKDFKRDFYPSFRIPKEILEEIKVSKEEDVQLNITLEKPWDQLEESSIELLAAIEKITKKLRVHRIEIVDPLQYPKYRKKG